MAKPESGNRKRLLIINESGSRVENPREPIQVMERFDGLSFQAVKKARRQGYMKDVDVVVLTREFGPVAEDERVPYYPPTHDWPISYKLRFDLSTEIEKKAVWEAKLTELISKSRYSEVFVNTGKSFLDLISDSLVSLEGKVIYAQGRMGNKAREMNRWIREGR